jgi:hypothetical protein
MTSLNKPNNKSRWTAAGAAGKAAEAGKTAEPDKSAPEAFASGDIPAASPSAPLSSFAKSEPIAPAEPIENVAVDETIVSAALAPEVLQPLEAPQAPTAIQPTAAPAAAVVELVKLETAPIVAAQEDVAGFAISASTPIATPHVAAWAFKGVELWSENAQAVLGFASALGKAKSLTEVVELQSRFASERFNRFAALAGEVAPPPKLFFFAA